MLIQLYFLSQFIRQIFVCKYNHFVFQFYTFKSKFKGGRINLFLRCSAGEFSLGANNFARGALPSQTSPTLRPCKEVIASNLIWPQDSASSKPNKTEIWKTDILTRPILVFGTHKLTFVKTEKIFIWSIIFQTINRKINYLALIKLYNYILALLDFRGSYKRKHSYFRNVRFFLSPRRW